MVVRDRTSCARPGVPTQRRHAGLVGIRVGASAGIFQVPPRPATGRFRPSRKIIKGQHFECYINSV